MNAKFLKGIVLVLILTTLDMENTVAQASLPGSSSNSIMPIIGTTEATDGELNFKTFEVEVDRTGNYFTEFWLIPAKYPDGSYTTFMVYVNDEYIGVISPSKGNWQAARVDGKDTLRLNEGTNHITIATYAPEFPGVETLKVALCESDAVISSKEYEEFLSELQRGICGELSSGIVDYSEDTSSVGIRHISNVPLEYTFCITTSFTKDQEINIMSSSTEEHIIDMVILGYKKDYVFNPQDGSSSGLPTPEIPGSSHDKMVIPYTPATSAEMQGLNWKGISEKVLNPNSATQLATVRITAPKTGLYLIRLRTKANRGRTTGNLYVNGAYSYENVPITLNYVDCVIPADGNIYATMTCCDNFGVDDPYLFIHGAGADRIVGLNDDGPKDMLDKYDLSKWDSYVAQAYFMPTTGISVSSYSSSSPNSKCSILSCVPEGEASLALHMRAKEGSTSGTAGISIENNYVTIPSVVAIDGSLTVFASGNIRQVTLYGLTGNLIGSMCGSDSSLVVPMSSLHVTCPGIYVMSVETTDGVTSGKILVK